MVEKTKASQGASVSKTGNTGAQSSLPKSKTKIPKPDVDGDIQKDPCPDGSVLNHAFDANNPVRTAISQRSKKPAAKQEISEQIGRQLRSVYNDVLVQPVPDRFLDLLRALEKEPK
jgi:hypothetical protein